MLLSRLTTKCHSLAESKYCNQVTLKYKCVDLCFIPYGYKCRYPSIKTGLKGNQSCYTSALATATQSITIVL